MGIIHISEAEAAGNFASVLGHVRSGAEVVIEGPLRPIAVVHLPTPVCRTIEECIVLLSPQSSAIMDDEFASDVALSVDAHRESLEPATWD